ncbi:hypothetical protein H310_10316 [Aphanomyces invadans]|uniref:Uncharacterized protein n=1 Tax=Aphanomyces invadans TaxID=157072 RepID=A0A024TR35_9STRA|nr:hypothetical protein H310_10316 [Aphanomyces invadans]ETV96620.1 hypothetical protein H310_10316 [Aphanomyces invadans]|eukprot:XP_008874883.1 hypothetical protein H310_10316 [Aphanomyces invadans]
MLSRPIHATSAVVWLAYGCSLAGVYACVGRVAPDVRLLVIVLTMVGTCPWYILHVTVMFDDDHSLWALLRCTRQRRDAGSTRQPTGTLTKATPDVAVPVQVRMAPVTQSAILDAQRANVASHSLS